MADTPDFTNVVAGQARLAVASAAYTPGVTGNIAVPLISTDRSLIVLWNSGNRSVALSLLGVQSGVQYAAIGNPGGPMTWGWSVSAYGVIDQQVTLSITGLAIGGVVTVLALPDEIPNGQPWAPASVQIIAGSFAVGSSGAPMGVELFDNSGNQQGTTAHPLVVTGAGAGGVPVKAELTDAAGAQQGIAGAPLIVDTAAGAPVQAELTDAAGNQQGTATHPLIVSDAGVAPLKVELTDTSGNEQGVQLAPLAVTPAYFTNPSGTFNQNMTGVSATVISNPAGSGRNIIVDLLVCRNVSGASQVFEIGLDGSNGLTIEARASSATVSDVCIYPRFVIPPGHTMTALVVGGPASVALSGAYHFEIQSI